ncbi:MAG: hypothetical protein KDD32_10625 [Bacteroidetes bacterium]|nr:hypothetical protein [Bacteroidota bacterium]
MPNHFHGLFFLKENSSLNLNKLIANGKRFWAYEIVQQLEKLGEYELLHFLQKEVSLKEIRIGKKHEIFQPSFDSKICYSRKMLETKLDYIHRNPNQGKWHLAKTYVDYPYSSAAFYECQQANSLIKHYMEII